MQHKYKILTLTCCAFLAVIGGCSKSDSDQASVATTVPVSIIPAPRDLVRTSGQFEITPATVVAFDGADAAGSARYFVDLLQRTGGPALQAEAASPAVSGGIRFQLVASESPADDAYTLDISPNGVFVSAADSRGLFYGAVTLWQLMTPGARDGDVVLPALKIADAPRFRWRGLMLDSARHFQSPSFVKQFIDWMALHKLNVLHWHLVDDQGWRIEIKKYPKLTSVGAWRVPAGAAAAADIDPATGKPRLHGGFYTQDEIRDIVAYAAQRHIVIVPEIEMPGHASASVAAYPQLGVAGSKPVDHVPADWGVYSTLYNIDDSTFAFLEDVLTETMALFPGEYIHVGGDEAVKDEWKASSKIQAQMRKLGIADEHQLQSWFIQRMEKFLSAHGRKLVGWDEILEGGLAPNATVMSWRGIDGAVAAAAAGHDAVLAAQPTLYFDRRQSNDGQPGRGEIVTLEDVYRFDPAPASIPPEQRKHILGVQATIFTEHMRTEARVEHMTFPRAAALAEVAWSPANRIDWSDFQTRLPAQLSRYDALGIRYAEAMTPAEPVAGRRTAQQLQSCTNKLVLALVDDAPLQGERAVFPVDIMNPCWIYPAADLTNIAAIKAAVGQVPFNFQIGADVKKIPLPKPQTSAGELEVRIDTCEGAKIATLPLAPAVSNPTVTPLPTATIAAQSGVHDLCFTFTRASVDPIWVIDSIELVSGR